MTKEETIMGLFQHKKEKGTAELPPTPPVLTPTEPDAASEGRAACMNRLESVLGALRPREWF